MTLRAKLFLASCALAALSFSACGGTEANVTVNGSAANTARPANAAPAATPAAPAATPATPAASPATPAASGAGVTGVASCDEYIALYEKCINNPSAPEAMKAAWRTALEQSRTSWKQAASTPQGKASLETTCPQMLASAKPTLEAYCK